MRNSLSTVKITTRYLLLSLLLIVIATSLYVRIRLICTPLERDEGEYAYIAQLILKGMRPYTHAYTMKLPGAAIVYALFMSIFGQNISSIRIGLILVNAACTGLLYLLGRRLFSTETAILAAVFYSLLSLSQSVMGIFAHATHFIVLFSLSGFIILRHGLVKRQAQTIFIGGICFGISFLMKQHAIVLIPFALLLQIWPQRKDNKILLLRDCFIFLIGSTVPYISVTLWLYNIGVFGNFWFWTVKYAIEYANGLSIAEGFNEFVSQITTIIKPNLLVWLLATAGIIVICRERKFRDERLFLIGYLAISFIMICPGLYFRPHYFVLLLPPIALLAAFATTSAIQTLARTVQPKWATATLILFLIITPSAYYFILENDYNFNFTPLEVSRGIYGTNPFPEAMEIASYIRKQTTEKDRIAILGSEPEILFYANRLSATGHIYMYGLMEEHKYAGEMQRQLINDIESTAPTFIVVVHNSTSWLLRPNSLNKVLDWGDSYIPLRYDEVGIVDIFGDKPTRYLWGEEMTGYEPESESFVSIFRRR